MEGETRGFSPSQPDSLDKLEAVARSYGVNNFSIVPDQSLKMDIGVSFFRACNRCQEIYSYFKSEIDKQTGTVQIKYNWGVPQLDPSSKAEFQKMIQVDLAEALFTFKYGPPFDATHPQINSDEAINLRRSLIAEPPLRVSF